MTAPKHITMMQFRAQPGEYVRQVDREGRTFILTYQGKPVARLAPLETTVVTEDGTVRGERPLTMGVPL